jgi:uncharacterized protein YidB (DUF937 family)
MGMLEELTGGTGGLGASAGSGGSGGGIMSWIQRNPQVVAAALSLLSNRQGSVGGSGGLGSLVDAFGRGGLGDVMSSWIGRGPNQSVSADELSQALGPDILSQFGQAAGVPQHEAGPALAELLPALVNGLTPDGRMPPSSGLEDTLSGLLNELGGH